MEKVTFDPYTRAAAETITRAADLSERGLLGRPEIHCNMAFRHWLFLEASYYLRTAPNSIYDINGEFQFMGFTVTPDLKSPLIPTIIALCPTHPT